jgi:hypothetical protein
MLKLGLGHLFIHSHSFGANKFWEEVGGGLKVSIYTKLARFGSLAYYFQLYTNGARAKKWLAISLTLAAHPKAGRYLVNLAILALPASVCGGNEKAIFNAFL